MEGMEAAIDYFNFKEGTMTEEMRKQVEKYGHPYRVSKATFTKFIQYAHCPNCGHSTRKYL